jgi:hypothetical protein
MTTYYLDGQAGSDERDGKSEATAWRTLSKANMTLVAGDKVRIKNTADYKTSIAPVNNGRPGAYIVYEAYDPKQKPRLIDNGGGPSAPIDLNHNRYIKIKNIKVDGLGTPPNANFSAWVLLQTAERCEFYDCEFYRCNGDTGIVCGGPRVGQECRYNKFVCCHFEECGYLTPGTNHGNTVRLYRAEFNLWAECTFKKAGHNLFASDYGRFNVVQDCTFDNDWGAGQGTRCVELSCKNAPAGWTGAGHNLFQRNIVKHALRDPNGSCSPLMKIEGVGQIVRFNLFYHATGFALIVGQRNGDVISNGNGKVYNNIFSTLNGGIFRASNTSTAIPDNVDEYSFVNNLYLRCLLDPEDEAGKENANFNAFASTFSLPLAHNCWGHNYHQCIAAPYLCWEKRQTLTVYEALYPTQVFGNLIGKDANLKAIGPRDEFAYYEPNADSLLIGAGVALTKATAARSNSTQLPVTDCRYFSDGCHMVPGDEICVGGSSHKAVITAINYLTNTLTLDRPLSWVKGDAVNLYRMGLSPSIGCYQHGGAGTPQRMGRQQITAALPKLQALKP